MAFLPLANRVATHQRLHIATPPFVGTALAASY
jgi:hypothetical protein